LDGTPPSIEALLDVWQQDGDRMTFTVLQLYPDSI